MKKLITILTAGVFTVLSTTAFACPKGTTLSGGTGPNHKGGKCVAVKQNGKATKPAAKATKKPITESKQTTTTVAKDKTVKSETAKSKTEPNKPTK